MTREKSHQGRVEMENSFMGWFALVTELQHTILLSFLSAECTIWEQKIAPFCRIEVMCVAD